VEVPKPSEGLEYTYARKPSTFDHEKKDLAHIWEVSYCFIFDDMKEGCYLTLLIACQALHL